MTYSAAAPTSGWRDSPATRILGSALSWFLFSLNFMLLFQSVLGLGAIGGSCASGGPYEIAVECPDGVALFAPLSVFGGLAAVAVGLLLAQGFGTPLLSLAWPVLFVGLGGVFLMAFVFGGDIAGLLIGGLFVIMGLVPLVLELRSSPQRVVIGAVAADGRPFIENGTGRSWLPRRAPNPEDAIRPGAGHWALAIAITAISAVLGYLTAIAWFASVG